MERGAAKRGIRRGQGACGAQRARLAPACRRRCQSDARCPQPRPPAFFFSFLSILAHAMAARPSVQNSKAHLTQSYNELGRELSSAKIRVVGNYTLGKVIGEGV
jgi:hypothetical protein